MNFTGKKVLVMGLGLHGGGLESARFMLKRGASVTVTDLRSEEILKPSIEKLDAICNELGYPPVKYVLGKHEIDDFKNADIVVKNPGVRPDSPFLKDVKHIETDISLFLAESPARLFAVTGTKGKSGTAAALFHILNAKNAKERKGKTYLGGNITVSPLTFIDELTENDDVVLELSSFQLGDLRGRVKDDGTSLLKPKAAILTAIMADHLDRYASMEEYINDKRVIYQGQDASCVTVAGDDDWGRSFLSETNGKWIMYSGKLEIRNEELEKKLLPKKLLVPGEHQRLNLLAAALAVYAVECENKTENELEEIASSIHNALTTYKGIEHRLEFFHEDHGIRFYNDSAATIPEAAASCIEALSKDAPLVLVTGGTDKNLDFTPLANACSKAKAVILLAGTGSDKLANLLAEKGIAYEGPFDDLKAAVTCALEKAEPGYNVALSPGCASFGMFLNEFDRGRRWKNLVTSNYTN